jgi:hypothetical protein
MTVPPPERCPTHSNMDTTPPPIQSAPSQTPQPPEPQPVQIGGVIRDIVIITVLTFIGGFIVGFSGGAKNPQMFAIAVAVSNFLMGIIGFIISGCLARHDRWRHLTYVAVGVWLAGLINVVFFGFSFGLWILSIVFIAIMMGTGGAISYIFKR